MRNIIENLKKEKKIIKNSLSLYILQLMKYLFPLITLPYILRVIGIEGYGIIVFSQAISTYGIMIVNYGFYLSGPKLVVQNINNESKLNEVYSSVTIIKTLIFFVSYLLLFLILISINYEYKLVLIFAYLIVLGEVMIPIWLFQGVQKMELITLLSVIGRGIGAILIILFVKNQSHIFYVTLFQSGGVIFSGLIAILIVRFKLKIRFIIVSFRNLLYYLKDGWNLFISQLATNLFSNLNVIVLRIFSTNEFVGIYGVGEKIVRLAVSAISPVTSAIFPKVSLLLKNEYKQGLKFLRSILKFGIIILSLCCILMFLTSDILVYFISGDYNSKISTVIRILSFLPLFIFINNIYGTQFMINMNEQKRFRNIILISSIFLTVTSFIMIPLFNFYGAAISSLISEIFIMSSMIFYVEKKYKVNLIFRRTQ